MDERLIEVVEQNEALVMASRIEEIRLAAKQQALIPNGKCHSCGEPFEKDDPQREVRKFCDLDCEEDWQQWFDAMKRRYGARFPAQSAYDFKIPEGEF